jgi:serine/threonine protein kinase
MVLEYASRGDLHSLLRKHGSIDHASTRFVMGEVAAALSSIHEAGLVYGDLKPENIVITEPGHIKLTDFGGCRPVTEEALQRIGGIATNLLKNLRDGDWKSNPQKGADDEEMARTDKNNTSSYENECFDEEDTRIEGTTAYLPPEVVMGAIPTVAADSWALGCVMFQCLSGRPPLLDTDDDSTRRRIVSFDVKETPGNAIDRLFADNHASSINAEARAMIRSLLNRVDSERPSMQQLASMDFFSLANVDIFSLHRQTAHPLDVGNVAPAPDAQWSQRQLSSIWSPQPAAYSVELPDSKNPTTQGQYHASPIEEGEEATGSFLPFTISKSVPPGLAKLSEQMVSKSLSSS